MGGSGGGGTFGSSRTPEQLGELVRKAEQKTSAAQFESELASTLGNLLAGYNGRDVTLTKERLDSIKGELEDEIESSFDQFFAGSVAKHTYVDGLSDIDSILLINDSDLEDKTPGEVLDRITNILQERLGDEATVTHGRMAVTIEYSDGMKIQILPAIKTGERLKIPSSRREDWSHIHDPNGFQEALTRRNQECNQKLVPTIKLAKAINGTLPEAQQLSGYHLESLAIDAFRNYNGTKSTAAMLPVFFEKAKDSVLTPIKNTSGQSIHVDDYLGAAGSEPRVNASHILGRIAKRMRNATAAGSKAQWLALFEVEE